MTSDHARPEPFTLRVSDEAIADLRERLARTRFPDLAPGTAWAYGTDVAYMRDLLPYWRDQFDWRAAEARLNGFPQFKAPVAGIDLHFLHVPGQAPNPRPLLLLHGWPGSRCASSSAHCGAPVDCRSRYAAARCAGRIGGS